MSEQICKDCKNYLQHYGLRDGKLFRIYCGHCTVSGRKRKSPDAKACDRFVPGTPDEEAFVSKEYLSKKLLHYILSLDLLPEIEDEKRSSNKKGSRG